jgi:hypothetical protein
MDASEAACSANGHSRAHRGTVRAMGGVAGGVALILALAFPPAFWLCWTGLALIIAAAFLQAGRTDIWVHTPWEPTDREPLPAVEASLGLAGIALMAVPLLVAWVKAS